MSTITIHVPDELHEEHTRIKRFFDAMIYKLSQNSHKSGFSHVDIDFCLTRMVQEIEELREAIEVGNSIETLLESADVANFAMIAAVAAIERPDAKIRAVAKEIGRFDGTKLTKPM